MLLSPSILIPMNFNEILVTFLMVPDFVNMIDLLLLASTGQKKAGAFVQLFLCYFV